MRCLLWLALLLGCGAAAGAQPPRKAIVLIGGPQSHGPFEHDFPDGIETLRANLAASPDARALEIRASPRDGPPIPPLSPARRRSSRRLPTARWRRWRRG